MVQAVVKKTAFFIFALFLAQTAGCGYGSKSLLPPDIKAIHIAPVKNAIDLSGEVSDRRRFRVTRPGVEVDVTNAIINRFIFDGNLKVTSLEKADAVLEAKLIDYRRDALRYSDNDDIQEYRLSVVLDVVVTRAKGHKVLWRSQGFAGSTSFFLSGPHATSEDEAVVKTIEDVARRVVEQTIELW